MKEGGSVHAPDLIIYGHVGYDVAVRGPIRRRTFGGAAFYSAAAASRAGAVVGLVCIVGRDMPDDVLTTISAGRAGIHASGMDSALFVQTYDTTEEVSAHAFFLNASEELTPACIPPPYAAARGFFITTAPPRQQREVLRWLAEHNFEGLVAIDTNLPYVEEFRELLAEQADRCGLLFVNAAEHAALRLPERPAGALIVKRGPAGASLYQSDGRHDAGAPPVHVLSTTGAGDVLAGTYLARLLGGAPPRESLQLAVDFASRFVAEGVSALGTFPVLEQGPGL